MRSRHTPAPLLRRRCHKRSDEVEHDEPPSRAGRALRCPAPKLESDRRTVGRQPHSAFLCLSRVTVRRLRRKGLLPTLKVGAAARTPRSTVLA